MASCCQKNAALASQLLPNWGISEASGPSLRLAVRQCHHWVMPLQPHLPCHAGVPLSAFGYFPALVTMYSLRKTKENKREQKQERKRPFRKWLYSLPGMASVESLCSEHLEKAPWAPLHLPVHRSHLQSSCLSSRMVTAQLLPHSLAKHSHGGQ